MIKSLLIRGVDINQRNRYSNNKTTLHLAIRISNYYWFVVNHSVGGHDIGCSHMFCTDHRDIAIMLIKYLIDQGADITAKNDYGKIPFDYATHQELIESLKTRL